jgi:hypothetical protein
MASIAGRKNDDSGQMFQKKIFCWNCRTRTGANVFSISVSDWWEDKMWSRENIPLVVMTAASAAILLFFAVSGGAMPASPRQHDGCGWLDDTANAPAWRRVEFIPKDLCDTPCADLAEVTSWCREPSAASVAAYRRQRLSGCWFEIA